MPGDKPTDSPATDASTETPLSDDSARTADELEAAEQEKADDAWDEFGDFDAGEDPSATEEDADAPAETKAADGEGDPPTEPAKEKKAGSEQDTEPPPEDGDKPAEGADIWADAPEQLRTAFEEANSKAGRAEQANRSLKGRISHLDRRLNSLVGNPGQQTAGATDPSKGGGDTTPKSYLESEEWKTIAEDYPDLATPFGGLLKGLEDRLDATATENQKLRNAVGIIADDRGSTIADEHESFVVKEFPDYVEVATSPEFGEWAKSQPLYVQSAIEQNWANIVDGAAVVDVITRFKQDTAVESPGDTGGSESTTTETVDTSKTDAAETRRTRRLSSVAGQPKKRNEAIVPDEGSSDDEAKEWAHWDKHDAQEAARVTG